MPGLTSAGFETQTLTDLRSALETRWRDAFGASMDVSDRSPDGKLLGISGAAWAAVWEVLEAIVSSQDPAKATRAFLDAICALTGTVREPARFSTATLTLTGTPTVVVSTGALVSTVSTEQQWGTTDDATLAAATAWASSTAYAAGAIRTNASRIYLCITAGTSAGAGGPTTTVADITDGTAHWRYLGEGAGYAEVAARATETGPLVGISGDISVIDTPVFGWSSVINVLDATLGRDEMTDAELRLLRELELARPGTSPLAAVRTAVLDVPDVTSVTVFQNITDVTDGDGVPPHSIEALVQGGDDQDIWDALLANVAAGIRTHGDEVGTATDEEGTVHTMAFSRPEEVLIYVSITLTYVAAVYQADGDAQVKAAIATAGNALANGYDVVASFLSAQAFSVPGVFKVSSVLISAAPVTVPVSSADIAITTRQRAVFDTTRVTVTSSPVVP